MSQRLKITLVVAVLAAVLMLVAAVNLVLVFVLFSTYPPAGRPDTELTNFVAPMIIGALPFLTTGALIAWALLGARAAKPRQQSMTRLALISSIGLPFIFLIGFFVGLFASAQELPLDSPADAALNVYQFTWLAAVLVDLVTLVLALVTRRSA
jgi:hypothetical protein